jgi:uncharacterized repeat protein (TIGR01451 family)
MWNITQQKHWLRIFLVSVSIIILFIGGWGIPGKVSAAGTTYYVALTGNDTTGDGSETNPWRTIQKAANTMTAGDTVYIKAGTYPEQVTPLNSGSVGNYITYAAYPGDVVTIDGATISLPSYESGLFHVEGKNYVKISGLRIINAGPNLNNNGIYVDNSSYIIIENNYTYNTVSSGIGVWGGNNIIIDGNEVVLACNNGEQESITVAGTDIFEIKNNYVHDGGPGDHGGEGIDAKDGASNGKIYRNRVHGMKKDRTGIYVDAWDKLTSNIEIYQNIVYDSGAGISLANENFGWLENVKIFNNIVYNNRGNGLEIGDWGESGTSPRPIDNVKFINNTAYKNGASWGGGFFNENPDATNVVVRNNIFSQNLSFQISNESAATLTVDHNLIDGYRGDPYETRGTDYVEGDPRFVDGASANFHLQSTSPAIDAGSATDAPSDDYEGNARPQDGDGNGSTIHDMGAYEVTPNLTLSSNTDPYPVQATTPVITYIITLQNNSAADATGVIITSTIPNSTTYASGGDSFDGTNIVWSGLTVAKDSSTNVPFQVTVTEAITDGDQLINTILASSAQGLTASIPANSVAVGLRSTYLPIVFMK